MENSETNSLSGYGKPPWVFKGSALYQFHLVKAETARAFIPKEFKLVEAFGYTLGGFFLANYEDSPAGKFDELVVIAGIVWNPPTSCAWAARVLVNSNEACIHGRKDVGLPSQVANFSKRITTIPETKGNRLGGFLGRIGMADFYGSTKNTLDINVKEMRRDADTAMDICSINLNADALAARNDSKCWMGPPIKISLPSFSGRTEDYPNLLKYTCQIECRVRAVSPARVLGPYAAAANDDSEKKRDIRSCESEIVVEGGSEDHKRGLNISVMLSKPILALEFSCLKMLVEAPSVVSR